MPAVSLHKLSKHYGDVVAVDDLDLELEEGEFFSMLGPSGSGKTTVLRLIAGFERPTAGWVRLGDTDVTALPPFARDVNTVFQDYAIFPHLDVLKNVEYGLRVKKVGKEERRTRALEALASVRLEGYEKRRPDQLSGGQRQRVALARALVNRPKVLLLDEPLGALDLKLRREMQLELKQIQREVGITFVFVTHDQEEALTMSDRIAVFNNGRVEQIATPVELYEHPASSFVAGFVGTSNRLDVGASKALGLDGDFAVRPEKLRLGAAGERAADGEVAAPGRVSEVVYLGPSTHTMVELDAGPRLTVSHPNEDRSIDSALERRGQEVTVLFRRDALIPLPTPPNPSEEETR